LNLLSHFNFANKMNAKGSVTALNMPLQKIKVLDIATMVAGPLGAALLGDLGAEVIKVEPPAGDGCRFFGPRVGRDSAVFISSNRNKRDIALDITNETARPILHELIKWADVVINNALPAARQKMGITYEELKAVNPSIIHLSVSCYGESGPYANHPGMDALAQAMSGFMAVTGNDGDGPMKGGAPIADTGTSLMVVIGALTGLWVRQQTGLGQNIEVNLLNTMLHLQGPWIQQYLAFGQMPPQTGNESPFYAPYGLWTCKDGQSVQIMAVSDKFFSRVCEAIGQPELTQDPRFVTNEGRLQHKEQLKAVFAAYCASVTSGELLEQLAQYEVLAAPVYNYQQAYTDPQVVHNEMAVETHHAALGQLKISGVPIKLQGTPGSIRRPPPVLGEHTVELLTEFGVQTEEITRLERERVIRIGS
jgi:crotonobetainyl-CoA:carnitine CoA-transferase CaiB-like acyl-CoA transferase